MKQIIPFNKEITFKTMISKVTSISLEHTLEVQDEDTIAGDFIVSGSYKMTEASQIDEEFSYKIPIEITIDSKYDTSNVTLDIDDFVYEVIDEEKLLLKIDLCIDNLELASEKEEEVNTITNYDEKDSERCIDPNEVEDLFLDTSTSEKLEIPVDNNDDNNDNSDTNDDDTNNNQDNLSLMPETLPYYPNKDENLTNVPVNNTNNNTQTNVASIFSAFKDTDETFSTYCIYIMRDGDNLDTVLNKYNTTRDILSEYNDLSDIRIGSKIIIPNSNE